MFDGICARACAILFVFSVVLKNTMWQAVVDSWKSLRSQQKASVVLLSLCGLLALGLSIYRVQATIREPFLVDKETISASKQAIGITPQEEEAKQKRTDTDGDGLSDWDEVNTYRTNPNLRDTCGDGIPDNIRVLTGQNLQCSVIHTEAAPAGSASGTLQTVYPEFDASVLNTPSVPVLPSGGQTVPSPQQQAIQQMLPRDPAAIRAALKGKVDQAKLDALSDADLLNLYDQAIAVQSQQPGTSTQATSTSTP